MLFPDGRRGGGGAGYVFCMKGKKAKRDQDDNIVSQNDKTIQSEAAKNTRSEPGCTRGIVFTCKYHSAPKYAAGCTSATANFRRSAHVVLSSPRVSQGVEMPFQRGGGRRVIYSIREGEMLKLTKKKGNTITPRRRNNLNGYRRRETTQIH